MSRKEDIQVALRACYTLIREYENMIRLSSDPKEKTRAQQVIQEQRELLSNYLNEYRTSFGDVETEKLLDQNQGAVLSGSFAPKMPYNNLPRPDYIQFVGREDELEWLRQRLSPQDRAWQIALTGIGGVGKSALALTIAHEYRTEYDQLPPDERFEAIVWVSAKEEVLGAYGREQADLPGQIMHTLEDVYTAISQTLEREDITRALPQDQANLVDKALHRQRTLLVMDNMESVRDERIKPFLRNLPPPTKALITSREWTNVADQWALTGLSAEEADALMRQESQTRGIELGEQERKRIFELTHGLPLPIKLGIARIASGESFAAVERWLGDATGDVPEYCIIGQIALARERDPNAWTILMACSLFDRSAGASREALGYVADLSIADRDAALSQLQRLFLINRTEQDRFWVLPIVQRYANKYLDTQELWIADRWLIWLADLSRTYGTTPDDCAKNIKVFRQEHPNLLRGVRLCYQQGKWETLFSLVLGTGNYLYLTGLFSEWAEMLEPIIDASNIMADKEKTGRVWLQMSNLASLRGRFEEALIKLDKAITLTRRHKNYFDLARAWSLQVAILFDLGQIDRAEQVIRRMLEMNESAENPQLELRIANSMAILETKRGNYDEASRWLDRSEQLVAALDSPRAISTLYYRRGLNLFSKGQMKQAEQYLLKSMNLSESWEERQYIANCKYHLALIYAESGQLELAKRMAEEAWNVYERLGIPRRQKRVEELLQRL